MLNQCLNCGSKLESTTVPEDLCPRCKQQKTGWVCPICHLSNAPSNKVCIHCMDKNPGNNTVSNEGMKFEGKTILLE